VVSLIWQITIDALGMAMIYVLLASGLNLIIGVNRIVLVAYGNFYMLGAYAFWFLATLLRWPYVFSLCGSILISAMLGGVVYLAIFRYTQRHEQRFLTNLTAALGLMMVMGQAAVLLLGTDAKSVPSAFPGRITILGAGISRDRVVIIVLGLLLTVAVGIFLRKTNIGRAMRAVAYKPDVAALQGVNPGKVYLATMVVGCGVAGFAGALIAPLFPVAQTMSSIIMIILLVVMFGGIGSMVGAIVAGLIFALGQSFGQSFIGTGLAQIVVFLIVGVIIYFRPGGLFGRPGADVGV
jgi:branched-chain amino acid transport system permease protein